MVKKFKTKDLQILVPKLREQGYYIPKEHRLVDWGSYTVNQINDIIDTLEFIRNEVDKINFNYEKKVGRPPTDPKNLAKAILFTELYGFPERKAEGWILLLGPHLGINERIDDRVLGKAYKNPNVIWILDKVFENNKDTNYNVGGDGTGLERSRKENYETDKVKGLYMTSIVDTREIVQEFDISGQQECQVMHKLFKNYFLSIIKKTWPIGVNPKICLDAGFVDKELAQLISDLKFTPYIFPKKNNTLKSNGYPAFKRMLLDLLKNPQKWLEKYHDRSHTESFHSSFKRVFGLVTKILDLSQYTQVLCRIIHNNRRKKAYFDMAEIAHRASQ